MLLGVWLRTWNVGSLSGKGGDVCVELSKRMIDECCLQVRWRGQGARIFGRDISYGGLEKEMELVVREHGEGGAVS